MEDFCVFFYNIGRLNIVYDDAYAMRQIIQKEKLNWQEVENESKENYGDRAGSSLHHGSGIYSYGR